MTTILPPLTARSIAPTPRFGQIPPPKAETEPPAAPTPEKAQGPGLLKRAGELFEVGLTLTNAYEALQDSVTKEGVSFASLKELYPTPEKHEEIEPATTALLDTQRDLVSAGIIRALESAHEPDGHKPSKLPDTVSRFLDRLYNGIHCVREISQPQGEETVQQKWARLGNTLKALFELPFAVLFGADEHLKFQLPRNGEGDMTAAPLYQRALHRHPKLALVTEPFDIAQRAIGGTVSEEKAKLLADFRASEGEKTDAECAALLEKLGIHEPEEILPALPKEG